MNQSVTYPKLNQFQTVSLIVGIIGVVLLGLGAMLDIEQFFRSYLFGYLFALSIPLGSLVWMMIHHVTGGGWGVAVRRIFESSAMTLPIMALLFIPVILATWGGFGEQGLLYEWSSPEIVEGDPIIAHKQLYMNPQAFLIRAIIYFVIWAGLALLLRSWSLSQDRTGNPALATRMRGLSGVGIVLFVLATTFAMFDWGMSLDPHWFSSMYGVLYMIGDGLITLAFTVTILSMLINHEPLSEYVSTKEIHDLGKLMFGFTVLWAYVSYGQYIIIWSGDVAEFTPWYAHRTQNGWQWVAVTLMGLHFFLPFLVLLSRKIKQNLRTLVPIAIWMIVMRLIDMSWLILPEFHESVAGIHWMDIAAPLGMAGIWCAIFIWILKSRPLLPMNDPNMEALILRGGHH